MTDATTQSDANGLRDKASTAAEKTRVRAHEAGAKASGTATRLGRRAQDGIEASPISILLGGAAIGLLAGALLPRTEQESEWLGPLGKRLIDGATAAATAAREASKDEIESLAPDRSTAKSKASTIVSNVLNAATDAGKEAIAR